MGDTKTETNGLVQREIDDAKRLWLQGDTSVLTEREDVMSRATQQAFPGVKHALDAAAGMLQTEIDVRRLPEGQRQEVVRQAAQEAFPGVKHALDAAAGMLGFGQDRPSPDSLSAPLPAPGKAPGRER